MSALLNTLQEKVMDAEQLINNIKEVEKRKLALEEKEQIEKAIKLAKKEIEKITDNMLVAASEGKKQIIVSVAKWVDSSRLDKIQTEYQKVIVSHFTEQGMKVTTSTSETKAGGSDSLFPNDIYSHYIDIAW